MGTRARTMLSSKNIFLLTPRIGITREIRKHFLENILKNRSIADFSKNRGVPYSLIYNLAHERIETLSARNYRTIFREEPPPQKPERVDGTYFRSMVALWIFLNDDITKSDLYLEFYGGKNPQKIDYRILSVSSMVVVLVLVYYFTGFFGLYLSVLATFLGLLPILANVSRTHAMGVLIVPTTLFFLNVVF